MTHLTSSCVQMFSGGRDSTLAAVRLSREWNKLILVTVTTANLVGLDRVERRLVELKPHLSSNTEWLHVELPHASISYRQSAVTTCLPCHHVYLVTGAIIAEQYGSKHLALGYTSYQSTWIEQTPYAIDRLRETLGDIGLHVVLPVADIAEKDQAIAELRENNLSESSLEQKCSRQVVDPGLTSSLLRQEVDRWQEDLRLALTNRQSIRLNIIARRLLGDLEH